MDSEEVTSLWDEVTLNSKPEEIVEVLRRTAGKVSVDVLREKLDFWLLESVVVLLGLVDVQNIIAALPMNFKRVLSYAWLESHPDTSVEEANPLLEPLSSDITEEDRKIITSARAGYALPLALSAHLDEMIQMEVFEKLLGDAERWTCSGACRERRTVLDCDGKCGDK